LRCTPAIRSSRGESSQRTRRPFVAVAKVILPVVVRRGYRPGPMAAYGEQARGEGLLVRAMKEGRALSNRSTASVPRRGTGSRVGIESGDDHDPEERGQRLRACRNTRP